MVVIMNLPRREVTPKLLIPQPTISLPSCTPLLRHTTTLSQRCADSRPTRAYSAVAVHDLFSKTQGALIQGVSEPAMGTRPLVRALGGPEPKGSNTTFARMDWLHHPCLLGGLKVGGIAT